MEMVPSDGNICWDDDDILAMIDFSDMSFDLPSQLVHDIPETDVSLPPELVQDIPETDFSLPPELVHDIPENDVSLSPELVHDIPETDVSLQTPSMEPDLQPGMPHGTLEADFIPHIPTTAPSLSSEMAHDDLLPKIDGCVHIPIVAPEFSTRPPACSQPKYNEGFWSTQEHCRFLEGLRKYGKGDWISIAELVGTRNHTQVASHAQKFELHQSNKDNNSRKRKKASIYDITIEDLEPEPDNNSQCSHQQINIVASSSLPMATASQFRPRPRNLWNLRLGDADNEDLFSVYANAIDLNQGAQHQNSQKSVTSSAPILPAAPHHQNPQDLWNNAQSLGFGQPANEYLSNMSAVSNLQNQRPQEECYQQSFIFSSSSRPPTLPPAPYQFQYGQQTPWNNQSLQSGLPINESLSDLGTLANMNQVPQEHYYQQIFTSSRPPPPYQFQPASGAGLQSFWNKQPLQVRCPSNEYLSRPQSQCYFQQSVPAAIPMPAHRQAHQAVHRHNQRPQDQQSVTCSSCPPTTLPASQFQPGEQNLWNNLDARTQSPYYYQLSVSAGLPMPTHHQPPAAHHDSCKRRRML